MVKAALGLSLDQVARAFRSALIGKTTIDSSLIDAVMEEKGQLIKKSGILNLVTVGLLWRTLAGWRISRIG